MAAPVRLIVGLGNPGPEYETTRHNAGFWLADHIADDLGATFKLEKSFFAWVARARLGAETIILAKPITFMNRSGQAVGALARFYKFTPEEVMAIHDELDFLPGIAKLKFGGGHAGHNGLRDIQSALSSPGFWRMRIGIGHPRTLGLAQQVAGFVLNQPRREELKEIEGVIDRCRAIVPALLRGEFEQATQQLHQGNL
ncbi:aminoacyl-tRNA hydrolase [Alcaligenaceae bacterium CGII-47]|nr:aminoacyl-tRNA hydrolase [Alcaligenaceae bacterium CGII-47]